MNHDTYDWEDYEHTMYPEGNPPVLAPIRIPLIRPMTTITSMGSCFAREIVQRLSRDGYNYLMYEPPYTEASVNWGQVVNTACMRQIFEYTFEKFEPVDRWWVSSDGNIVRDPYRCNVTYSKGNLFNRYRQHVNYSRQALSTAKVIVLTLGLIETWRDKRDGSTFYMVPPKSLYDPEIHEFYLQDVVDVLCDLNTIAEILEANNPEAQVILTVSPIPLRATFRDIDPVIANSYSKATLRVAAEVATTKHDNFHYFPSYELVTQGIKNPYQDDGRHLTDKAIESVVDLFKKSYTTV
jgi:hypothetical protein